MLRSILVVTCPVLSSLSVAVVLAACFAGGSEAAAPAAVAADAAPIAVDGASEAASVSDEDRGEAFIHARGCVRCHQSEDPADGVLSGSTEPRPGSLAYPKNLTPDSDTGIGDWSDRLILRAIREGVDDDGAPLCATMPRYVDMGDDEGAAIVAYLRALPAVRHRIPESACGDGHDAPDASDDAGGDAGLYATPDAPDAADAGIIVCVGLAGPQTKAACHACGDRTCQANGCYGGYFCDIRTTTCRPPPTGCTAS